MQPGDENRAGIAGAAKAQKLSDAKNRADLNAHSRAIQAPRVAPAERRCVDEVFDILL